MSSSHESPRRRKLNELAADDIEWTPTAFDDSATAATIESFMSDCRAQMADTVPWNLHVWRLLLPRGRQFAARWRARQPHEQISSQGHKRPTDHYLVKLKKHLLDQVFSGLSGNIIDYLRSDEDESDVVKRAAIQRRRQSLDALSEMEQRTKLRTDTGQWISNTVKKREGPRWLQAYEKAYLAAKVSPRVGSEVAIGTEGTSADASANSAVNSPTQIYQGRAYSAKELLAMSEQYKDEVTARAARLIIDSPEVGVDDTSIRYWRRAMEEVWGEAPEDDKARFTEQAVQLGAQINQGYQQIDKVFQDVVVAARDLQAIDGAFGAIVIETRKWSPIDRNWQAVRYVLTTIPSKSPRKLQTSWDFVMYDQKVTDWCDARRVEVEQSTDRQDWQMSAPVTSPPVSPIIETSQKGSTSPFQLSPTPSPRRTVDAERNPILALHQPRQILSMSTQARGEISADMLTGSVPVTGSAVLDTAFPAHREIVAHTQVHAELIQTNTPLVHGELIQSESSADQASTLPSRGSQHDEFHSRHAPSPSAELSESSSDVADTDLHPLVLAQEPERQTPNVAVSTCDPASAASVDTVNVQHSQVLNNGQVNVEDSEPEGEVEATTSTGAVKRKKDSDWARNMAALKEKKRIAVVGYVSPPDDGTATASSRPKRGQATKANSTTVAARLLRSGVRGK